MRCVLLIAPLLLAACDDTVFEGGEAVAVEGEGIQAVRAIVDNECLTCHSAASALGGLDLETDLHGATVDVTGAYGVPIIAPGDLENSMFYLKTTAQQGSDGTEMPVGSGGLPGPDNEIIANWILDGAPPE